VLQAATHLSLAPDQFLQEVSAMQLLPLVSAMPAWNVPVDDA
jgi:hypothetical protein